MFIAQIRLATCIRWRQAELGTTKGAWAVGEDHASEQSDRLCLDQFLKLCSIVGTGGQAKLMIQGGEVKVNGVVETRRRRKLTAGDVIEVGGQKLRVEPSQLR